MNSIDRVKAAIRFKGPDRLPVYRSGLGDVLPMAMLPSRRWRPGQAEHERGLFPYHQDDMVMKLGLWRWKRPWWARAPEYRDWLKLPREEVDEFGAIWNRDGGNTSLGHPGRPAIPDWSEYDSYMRRYAPDALDRSRYETFLRVGNLTGRRKYRMCILGGQGPFTMAHAIRGFTNFLVDHRRNPDELRRLLARITGFYVDAAKCWVEYGARPHGFMLYDDLGDQYRPFMSPEVFADFYGPVFRTIIDTAHGLGCDMHLHSCGKIDLLMPALIDWGLDAFEFDSPRMVGYADLERFRGSVMIWGCVDIQRIYATGTPEECEQEVWHMVRNMGTHEGGFGAYFYPQTYHIGAPPANVAAFKRGLQEYGDYSKIPKAWWECSLGELPAPARSPGPGIR